MFSFLLENTQLIGTSISFFALIISCIALRENKKHNIYSYRAKLIFNVIQQNQKLYILVQNLGQTSAFDIDIKFNYDIESPMCNLHVVPPNTTYRYILMESSQISVYEHLQVLEISVQYRDIYCNNSFWLEKSSFPLLELLKYTCSWNEKQYCFDINRI